MRTRLQPSDQQCMRKCVAHERHLFFIIISSHKQIQFRQWQLINAGNAKAISIFDSAVSFMSAARSVIGGYSGEYLVLYMGQMGNARMPFVLNFDEDIK